LLNEPVDTWRKELDSPVPSPLTAEYPLVVRSLERIKANQWHRVWRHRWQRLHNPIDQEDRIYCATGKQSEIQLEAILKGKAGAVVLVLSEPPAPSSAGQQEVLAGLRSGIPAIVWRRGGTSASDHLCDTVKSMIGAGQSASGLAELPEHVAKLRQLAWSEDPDRCDHHIGHDLVILWDDPERQPGRAGGVTGKVRT
jgi:vWA-MoxR associated protein C-terminal domain